MIGVIYLYKYLRLQYPLREIKGKESEPVWEDLSDCDKIRAIAEKIFPGCKTNSFSPCFKPYFNRFCILLFSPKRNCFCHDINTFQNLFKLNKTRQKVIWCSMEAI